MAFTWMWGFWRSMKISLHSSLKATLGPTTSRTSKAICIEFERVGWNFSSFPLLIILLWTFTSACSSFDCSKPLRKTNSSSELGRTCLASSNETKSRERAEINNKYITHYILQHVCVPNIIFHSGYEKLFYS